MVQCPSLVLYVDHFGPPSKDSKGQGFYQLL